MESFTDLMKNKDVPLFTFVLVSAILGSLIVFFLGLSIYFYKKIKDLTKVRYGFGGKPIFSFLIVLFIAVSIPITYFASKESVNYIFEARMERDVEIIVDELSKDGDIYYISFMAIPYINNVSWSNKSYNITWRIEGEYSFEKVEMARSVEYPSYFVKKLKSGEYTITVTVESENYKVIKQKRITLE